MNEKERLIRILRKETVDRPAVICPGGMMNGAVTEILEIIKMENFHTDAKAMAEVAKKVREMTGFENYGVPFCMTVEAEPFGIEVDFGSICVEPYVKAYNDKDLDTIMQTYSPESFMGERMQTVIDAVSHLKNDEVPVIGSVTGPFSTATSIVDPLVFMRLLRKKPELAEAFLDYMTRCIEKYCQELAKAGADVIAFSDPTATGEILGLKNFNRFVVPTFERLFKTLKEAGIPYILHVCGNSRTVAESVNHLIPDAFSMDSMVSPKESSQLFTPTLMGNISTQLLHTGKAETIKAHVNNCVNAGFDIIAPACGLGMGTPVSQLRVLTTQVKGVKESLNV